MSIWSQATQLATKTPDDRNRYVDFLRAISILVVVAGHWLVAAPYYHDGSLSPGALMEIQPGTQWLTWIFQVMPIFFIVGGYANAVSIQSARRRGTGYAGWLAARLSRLVTPLLLLLVVWAVLAAILHFSGVSGRVLQLASRAALIPTWFLAIYIMVVVLAPATYIAWQRWGFASLWVFAILGVLGDLAYFESEMKWIGWSNYFWVWLSVHHLGYAWRDGRLASPTKLIAYAILGFLALMLLIFMGPYPLAMVGSPSGELSNNAALVVRAAPVDRDGSDKQHDHDALSLALDHNGDCRRIDLPGWRNRARARTCKFRMVADASPVDWFSLCCITTGGAYAGTT